MAWGFVLLPKLVASRVIGIQPLLNNIFHDLYVLHLVHGLGLGHGVHGLAGVGLDVLLQVIQELVSELSIVTRLILGLNSRHGPP